MKLATNIHHVSGLCWKGFCGPHYISRLFL